MNMIVLRLALRNIVRRFRKNLVVGILVAIGVAVFFLGNSLIDSSLEGINRSFVENFTGDLSISAHSDAHFGIFGPDVPVISAYQQAPLLPQPDKIFEQVIKTQGVEKAACVVSFPLAIDMDPYRSAALGIGTMGQEYFALFPKLHFVRGAPPKSDDKPWIVMPETRALQMEQVLGHPLAIGQSIVVSMAHDTTFTIREVSLAGTIAYEPENDALSKSVILDGKTLRDLSGLGTVAVKQDPTTEAPKVTNSESIDDLFGQETDTTIKDTQSGIDVNDVAHSLAVKKTVQVEKPLGHDGAWHFILLRAQKGTNLTELAALLRSGLQTRGWSVEVRDWRDTAGVAASYVYALQVMFYAALGMLGAIIVMITINSLVVSVIERSGEIGTMRAIGAHRGFIRMLFVVEITVLCFSAAIVGVVLGLIGMTILNSMNIAISNEILALLFGGTKLRLVFNPVSIFTSIAAALCIAAVAWIHPVRMALRIQPVQAMHTK